MLLYLVHKNNPEKTQYLIEDVKGDLKGTLEDLLLKKESVQEKLKDIIRYIEDNKVIKMTDVIKYIINMNWTDVLQKYQYIIKILTDEQRKKAEDTYLQDVYLADGQTKKPKLKQGFLRL